MAGYKIGTIRRRASGFFRKTSKIVNGRNIWVEVRGDSPQAGGQVVVGGERAAGGVKDPRPRGPLEWVKQAAEKAADLAFTAMATHPYQRFYLYGSLGQPVTVAADESDTKGLRLITGDAIPMSMPKYQLASWMHGNLRRASILPEKELDGRYPLPQVEARFYSASAPEVVVPPSAAQDPWGVRAQTESVQLSLFGERGAADLGAIKAPKRKPGRGKQSALEPPRGPIHERITDVETPALGPVSRAFLKDVAEWAGTGDNLSTRDAAGRLVVATIYGVPGVRGKPAWHSTIMVEDGGGEGQPVWTSAALGSEAAAREALNEYAYEQMQARMRGPIQVPEASKQPTFSERDLGAEAKRIRAAEQAARRPPTIEQRNRARVYLTDPLGEIPKPGKTKPPKKHLEFAQTALQNRLKDLQRYVANGAVIAAEKHALQSQLELGLEEVSQRLAYAATGVVPADHRTATFYLPSKDGGESERWAARIYPGAVVELYKNGQLWDEVSHDRAAVRASLGGGVRVSRKRLAGMALTLTGEILEGALATPPKVDVPSANDVQATVGNRGITRGMAAAMTAFGAQRHGSRKASDKVNPDRMRGDGDFERGLRRLYNQGIVYESPSGLVLSQTGKDMYDEVQSMIRAGVIKSVEPLRKSEDARWSALLEAHPSGVAHVRERRFADGTVEVV